MTLFAEKIYPEYLLPEELDDYLDKGWYRMGQSIFTTHFLCFEGQIYSALWARLPLQNFAFSKSQRKLLRKNGEQFEISFHVSHINAEKEILYSKYKKSFNGILAPTLNDSLLDRESINVFHSMELQIRHDGKLIGYSVFDVGNTTSASIIGVYDPDYQKYSLGYYTMLLEIEYCLKENFNMYYPGYVVPGYYRFDYKLRIGDVEYLDLRTNTWESYTQLEETHIPKTQMTEQLALLQEELNKKNILCKDWIYPLFEANLFGFWAAPYLDYPLFLQCYNDSIDDTNFTIVVYNIRQQAFDVLRCAPFDDIQLYFNEAYTHRFNSTEHFMKLIINQEVLFRSNELQLVADFIGYNG